VLRGSLGGPIDAAGVKVVGDFVDNYKKSLPSELAVLTLFDRFDGRPKAILDASGITDMRTGAVTAIGAKYLARKGSKVLGHIGARGTAYCTDLGMTGPLHSVIGFDPATVLPRFINGLPTRFEVGGWPVVFNALRLDVDAATGRALAVERLQRTVEHA
jgi:hypothetical protein